MNAPPKLFNPDAARFGASRSQKRVEDDRLLTGQGVFSDDRRFANEAALVVLRSPHAHARIASIDASAARAAPGVLAVYTGADLAGLSAIPILRMFKRSGGEPAAFPPRYALARDVARYLGEPVAAVVAETRLASQDAAELIAVEYEELPVVVDPRQAVRPGSAVVWPEAGDNVAAESRIGNPAAVEEAFKRAAHVTGIELHNQRVIINAMEPRCAIAVHDAGRTTLYTQNQTPTGLRRSLAEVFHENPDDFRVVIGDVGGGFGLKTSLAQEEAVCVWAARQLGRPVRWRADRSEEFLNTHHGRDQHFKAQLALDADGRCLAMKSESLGNVGSVTVQSAAMIPLFVGPKVQTSVYHVPAVDYHIRAVLTNTVSTGAYRGAGRPEANFIMERVLQKASMEMGIDPVEMRRRNFVTPAMLPYTTHLGEVYDSGDFARMLDGVLEVSDWKGFPARRQEAARRGKLRGRGLAVCLEWTGATLAETVNMRVSGDGSVAVFVGTQGIGQGLETTVTQLVAEVLQIDTASIRVVQGDTDQANGGGAVGSRTAFVGGSAVVSAGHKVVAQGKDLAAKELEAAADDVEYRNGRFAIAGTDRSIGLFELAGRQAEARLHVAVTENSGAPSWPNSAMVVEVEIDPATGVVKVVAVSSRDDIGRIINLPIVQGQIHGGVAQGVGQALMEQAVYDPDSGQLLTGSFMDYCMPRASDFPHIASTFDESVPCLTNLLGAKGVGEIGTIGAVPATVHAVIDALADYGVTHIEMPITSEKVWRIIQGGKQEGKRRAA
ncbi:MAG TPA: xanthine dehydrogenase family protein molybdopterin-binding subunit [Burkholderiales bacterium]|nr:xanthine dehydrogenase family protein molybdopterin-binding subunit [Burkholderiales bacterium]